MMQATARMQSQRPFTRDCFSSEVPGLCPGEGRKKRHDWREHQQSSTLPASLTKLMLQPDHQQYGNQAGVDMLACLQT